MRRFTSWAVTKVFVLLDTLQFLGFLLMALSLVSFRDIRSLQRGKMRRIMERVEQGTLRPDEAGVVLLPAKLSLASCNGKAYVLRRGELLLVFVPVWFGKGGNVQGNLICNRPLTDADMDLGYAGEPCIGVLYPCLLFDMSHGLGIYDVYIGKRWGTKGYFVFNSLS